MPVVKYFLCPDNHIFFVNFLGCFCHLTKNIQCEAECAGRENTHIHSKDGHWKFQGRGGSQLPKF